MFLSPLFYLDYSQAKANPPHPTFKVGEVMVHDAVCVYCEGSMTSRCGDIGSPKGEKMLIHRNIAHPVVVKKGVSTAFMNNSG